MEKLAKLIIRFRIAIITLVLLVTGAFAATLPLIETDDDVMQFLPGDDPEIKLFHRVNERFGGLDVAIVGLEADDFFTTDRLKEVRKLTRSIKDVEGVFDVMSFTEVPDPRPGPTGLVVEPLVVDQVPVDSEELEQLKARVLANKNAVGNLISKDGQAAMILCFLGGKRPPLHVAKDIKKETSNIWTGTNIFYGGAPFVRLHLAGGTKKDIRNLTPLVALVVLIITFIIFRRPTGVLLSLGIVGVSIVWLMGSIALRGKGLTLIDSSLPTLLMAIGGAYGIHILAAYFNGKATTVRERVIETLKEVGSPVLASSLTTAAGFFSFQAMDVEPLREYGFLVASGVLIAGGLALLLIPAVLSFGTAVPKPMRTSILSKPLGRVGGWAERRRMHALAGAVILAVIGLGGVMRLAPEATLDSFFAEGSEPDEANKFLERHFGGSVYVQVFFEGDMRSPFVLAQMRKIVEFARGMDEVVQVASIIDHIVMMSEGMGGRADLPLNRDRTRNLYPMLEGNAAIDQLISPEKDAGLMQIRLKHMPANEVNRVVSELSEFVKKEVDQGVLPIKVSNIDAGDRDFRMDQIRKIVSRRVVRLVAMHNGPAFNETSVTKIADKLKKLTTDQLEPGGDLTDAVARVVDEHISGVDAVFEEPEVPIFEEGQESTDEQLAMQKEWKNRAALATSAFAKLSLTTSDLNEVKSTLAQALPLTCSRDPEGLGYAADLIASGLDMTRDTVRSKRMTGPGLAAMGVDNPSDQLKDRVSWAMTDIFAGTFGFPDQSKNASRVKAYVTGQPVINSAFGQSAINNQLNSLCVSMVVLLIILSLTFRSVITGIKALIPPVFMLCVSVGVMGAAHIPIDMTTSMIAAIALGIGVDYSIHFLWRRRRRGESLSQTTAKVGPSVASNAVQVSAGFAVISLSSMVPMQRFGMLVALTMLLAAVATFILLPALRAEGSVDDEEADDAEPVPSFKQ